MCGIAGIWDKGSLKSDELLISVKRMAKEINHRGPDSNGFWLEDNERLAFSHARLSILDLSEAGSQPMTSKSKRYTITFNGEIYNHKSLRKIIDAHTSQQEVWRGDSDTETLLSMIDHFGLRETLNKCTGMFAFAIWDKANKKLTLVRDRFGEKPLYWGWNNKTFFFASDLAALKSLHEVKKAINRNALATYFEKGFIPAPLSIYKGIYQLKPGHLLEINNFSNEYSQNKIIKWWDTEQHVKSSKFIFKSEHEAIQFLESSLISTIKTQSNADVPLGVFLSGGIDSSLITALFQSFTNSKIESFTISFPELTNSEKGYNEAPYAKGIANYLGTNHNEIDLSLNEVQNIIQLLPKIYSEPFADSSQIPSYLVCKEARRSGLIVALSGDGGDELFGGYNRHYYASLLQKFFGHYPHSLRNLIGNFISKVPLTDIGLNLERRNKLSFLIKKSNSLEDVYKALTTNWDLSDNLVLNKV